MKINLNRAIESNKDDKEIDKGFIQSPNRN